VHPSFVEGRGRSEHRVAGERQLLLDREDTACHLGRGVPDRHENRLELPHLLGNPAQFLCGTVEGVAEHDNEPIAAIGRGREDVDVPIVESNRWCHWHTHSSYLPTEWKPSERYNDSPMAVDCSDAVRMPRW